MHLENLIDLIAEVAVKRTTQIGKRRTRTTGPTSLPYWIHSRFQAFIRVMDAEVGFSPLSS
jgi:hypothetical protein